MDCPTMRIKSEPSPDNEAGFVVINVKDFDPDTMQDFDAKEPSAEELAAAELAKVEAAKAEALRAVAAANVPAGGVVPPWGK
ncbi:hypothetical protein UFOVP1254_3 [uncultured Caudovirales phage]|uniref:Uncharacterized protein n=1 Tax=uncultured Caudovirales phage TaxID=2100421 RepID=A0A6J5RBC9_9CAUD|nr:hypothetical protein UFOVP1254_3 [uncultured Caudovirales phage]